MNSQELLEYVRRVKDLEIGVYEAQQIQDKFYQSVKANKPRKPAEPRYLSGMIPPPPQEPDGWSSGGFVFCGACLFDFGCLGNE